MKKASFLALAALYSVVALAQDGGNTNVDVNLKGNGGSSFPWLLVIGGVVFILLLVALLSGRGSRNKVVEKRTVVRD